MIGSTVSFTSNRGFQYLSPVQYGQSLADTDSKCIFLNEYFWCVKKFSLK